MKPLSFIGVPIDSVSRNGGAEHGPATLRELGLPSLLGGEDGGDLEVRIRGEERDAPTGILAGDDVLETTATIRGAVAELVGEGVRPFLAGGCCAELPGALAGVRDALGAVGLVHLDGHLDLYDGETSATGEAADMPISVALGLGPATWVEACGGASVEPQRTALVGFRDRAESIEYGMRQPETLDQAVFPATDYLMPDGLSWAELAEVLPPLLDSPQLIGASLACYNPKKDPDLDYGRTLVERLSICCASSKSFSVNPPLE